MPFDQWFWINTAKVHIEKTQKEVKQQPQKKQSVKVIKISSNEVKVKITPEGLKIRELLTTEAEQIRINLEGFLHNPPNPLRRKALYSYYLLEDTKQIALDYFPPYFNARFVPYIDKAIKFVLPTAKKQFTSTPSLQQLIADYLAKVPTVKQSVTPQFLYRNLTDYSVYFSRSVENYLTILQQLESQYYGEILTPQTPKDKVATLLAESLKINPILKPYLKPAVEIFLDFSSGKMVNVSPLEEYKFYIENLGGQNNGF
jgi:hypothetical protein